MSEKLRVIITDDHKIYREAAATVLRTCRHLDVVGFCEDGEAAVKMAAELKPDLIVMDIHLDQMNGLEATSRIKTEREETRVIIYSIDDSIQMQQLAKKSGADGFISKAYPVTEFCNAVRSVLEGNTWFQHEIN